MKSTRSCTKRNAAIFREAAQLVAERCNVWSCCAIEEAMRRRGLEVSTSDWSQPTIEYRQIYSADGDGNLHISDFDAAGGGPVRILALCFMAAAVEAGDICIPDSNRTEER